ncbi:MAG TPA: hypothetical protein VK602_00685, partial [Phyllobacterium sp.]|nr:hypothetical protein [Phyllobacterium sp.]
MTETVHTYARQFRLCTVMLKPDEEAPFRPNKARLRRILVLLSRYLELGLMVLTACFLTHSNLMMISFRWQVLVYAWAD